MFLLLNNGLLTTFEGQLHFEDHRWWNFFIVSKTFGADGKVSTLELGGGIKITISGIGIFYPDGTETQKKGVKVDVQVHPTIQGLCDGRDEVLEKALELAKS